MTPPEVTERVQRKLAKSRTQLLLGQPFFGTLCLRLKLVAGPVQTTATDGSQIIYNPEFIDKLTAREVEAVIAEDVLHCALAHHCRRGTRDPKLWNEAADLAINPILKASGFTLPPNALLDPAFDNLSAEEIYARRSKKQGGGANSASQGQPKTESDNNSSSRGKQGRKSKSGQNTKSKTAPDAATGGDEAGDANAGWGEVLDAAGESGNPASEAEVGLQQAEWNVAADQALRSAMACGRAPGGLERLLSQARESKQDWRAILREFIAATTPSDYSWFPPNRRYVGAGLYLPSIRRNGMGEIVVAVDTSGSIGQKELEQFAGEITAISDEAKPEAIHVVYCDVAVQRTERFEASETIRLEAKGGGGTDFRPPFQWAEENGIAPVAFLYLTDLCCHSYPEPPEYPVLWVTISRKIAPFGETVQITVD